MFPEHFLIMPLEVPDPQPITEPLVRKPIREKPFILPNG
jgi:hypothetical protein